MATREQLRSMQATQPFRPFLIKLADGRAFGVNHPELVSCSMNGRELVVHDEDGMHRLEMLLIAEMTRMPIEPSKAKDNGA